MVRPNGGKTPEHIKRTNAARSAAIKRLIEAHPIEWRSLYQEEAVARGVTPRTTTIDQKIAQLEDQLRALKLRQVPPLVDDEPDDDLIADQA